MAALLLQLGACLLVSPSCVMLPYVLYVSDVLYVGACLLVSPSCVLLHNVTDVAYLV